MKERPILFSGGMVCAILADTKTQTRRVIRPEWSRCLDLDDYDDRQRAINDCPYGAERLWVRETWALNDVRYDRGPIPKERPADLAEIIYRADGELRDQFEQLEGDGPPWRPSIHMPRWASRLSLEVTGVRVERLQAITEEDAHAEGVDAYVNGHGFVTATDLQSEPGYSHPRMYRDGYEVLWNALNADRGYGWEVNPWIWCLTFRRVTA